MSDLSHFERQPHNRGRGSAGEQAAVAYLERRGYRILERNARTRAGEIDVVAEDGDTVCFVEVKARLSTLYGPAVAAVTPGKQRRLTRAAALYLATKGAARGLDRRPCRFDVLGLDAAGDDWEYTLIRNAFEARW